MSIFDVAIRALDGGPADLQQYRGRTMLVVNVASRCGLTPQYASLQRLYETYADRGLVVLGVPCNQFGMQEPGTSTQIRDFCEVNFGITFPITEKVDVNGSGRHDLFTLLTEVPDADGVAGDVRWNFEKFLVHPDGSVGARFRPLTDPLAPELVAAVESNLDGVTAAEHRDAAAATPRTGTPSTGTPPVDVLGPLGGWPSLADARWPAPRDQSTPDQSTPDQSTPDRSRPDRSWSAEPRRSAPSA